MILRPVRAQGGRLLGYAFICPGCEDGDLCIGRHWVPIAPNADGTGLVWSFNGNLDAPTFSPSLLNEWNEGTERTPNRCHVIITDGTLAFCADCTHALAGQTVPMVAFDEE